MLRLTGCASFLSLFRGNADGEKPWRHTLRGLRRYALLAGAGFSQGLVVGPLVNAALHVSPGIVLTAFLATSAIFACFSGAAMVARRRR